ncbi:hypothetical protein D9619_013226 [Psilocybe cf. subviscida]|uniref:UBC core domain-containing protein n=1 Tax=Psilocybe cf. subviscida TaxID=2480587 RepID=A0A8H5EZ21_9AGAR|nr:hypothetical protein D9619_013226 [Psilocybe cf. subviscida]
MLDVVEQGSPESIFCGPDPSPMSSSIKPSHQLLSRLYKDLSELQENPYPGVAVFTDDANLRKLCLVLTPPGGPWTGLALHFDVELGEDWPTSPPRVSSSVPGISHPNLYGSWICCDLLKPIAWVSHENGYTGGYTPALTLRGLFLQFLTFFSSTSVDQDYGGAVEIGDVNVECYAWDDSIAALIGPGGYNYSGHNTKKQLALAEQYKNSGVAEKSYLLGSGHTFHKSKVIGGVHLHKVIYVNRRRTETLALIKKWKCPSCTYGSASLPHDTTVRRAPVSNVESHSTLTSKTPHSCYIDILNDDVLGEIAEILASESVISFSKAWPRFRLISEYNHVLRRKELLCFYLRTPLTYSILGVGVSINRSARSLSSDFDWLSMAAFDEFDVRHSIEKQPFEFFLPLAFNRPHFRKAEREIWRRLGFIDRALCEAEAAISRKTRRPATRRTTQPLKSHQAIEVLYRMMNNIVVSLMKSCDESMSSNDNGRRVLGYESSNPPKLLHASEKAVVSYCHLFHLVIRLCVNTPAILQDATRAVQAFIRSPAQRLKRNVPDMGEFLVLVMLVLVFPPKGQTAEQVWATLVGKFLEEALTRNVRWVLQDAPELEFLERDGQAGCEAAYRLNTTFEMSKTSLRLIMFQVTFLNAFRRTYSGNLGKLDDNYGVADKDLPEQMVVAIKEIYAVDSWPQFFRRVNFAKGAGFTKDIFTGMLRDCVKLSGQRGYHRAADQIRVRELQALRVQAEKEAREWL